MNKNKLDVTSETKKQTLIYMKFAKHHINKLIKIIEKKDKCLDALVESQIVINYLKNANNVIIKDECIKSYLALKEDKNNDENIKRLVKIFSYRH